LKQPRSSNSLDVFPATWLFERRFYEEKPCPATCQAIFVYTAFSRITADRQAYTSAKEVLEMCYWLNPAETPFESIRGAIADGVFGKVVKMCSASLDNKKIEAVHNTVMLAAGDSPELDICNTTVEQMKRVGQIGDKTSRFLLMYTSQSHEHVLFDSCIYRYHGLYCSGTMPKRTELVDDRYAELEQTFLGQVVDVIGIGARATHVLLWDLSHGYGGRMASPERLAAAVNDGTIVPTLDWSMV